MSRPHRERRRRSRSFYERALTAGEQELLEEAREIEGLDDEVALLRMEILRLVEEQDADPRAFQAGLRLLIQALIARHRLTNRQAEHLGDAAAQLLEQFGAIFATGGEVRDE